MSAVECEFFGGPMHGQTFQIHGDVNEVKMRQADPDKTPALDALLIDVKYTRVFNSRTPTDQFEYVGKALP